MHQPRTLEVMESLHKPPIKTSDSAPTGGMWRKYGPWDYKQQSSKYRDYTLYNFGAIGAAADFTREDLLSFSRASKPTPQDVAEMDNSELLQRFPRDVTDLNLLRSMVEHDARLIRIAPDFTWLEGNAKWPRDDVGITEARWNEYRVLFKKLSLPEGVVRTADFPDTIFFIAVAKVLCTGGSSFGFAYSAKPLHPIAQSVREDLDSEARKNPKRHYAYVFKPLQGNWYAFYQIDW